MNNKLKDRNSIFVDLVTDVTEVNRLQLAVLVRFALLLLVELVKLRTSVVPDVILTGAEHDLSKFLESDVSEVNLIVLIILILNGHRILRWLRVRINIYGVWLKLRID